MKRDGKYRFSLQFSDRTEENRAAGEFLERLGNKKSTVIVAALNEYWMHHPEIHALKEQTVPVLPTVIKEPKHIRKKEEQQDKEMQMSGDDMEEAGVSAMFDNLEFF